MLCFHFYLESKAFIHVMGALSCNCTVVPECSQTAVTITNKLGVVSVVKV